MKLNEIMTSEALQTIAPEATLAEAAKKMKSANCGVLPVVINDNELIGMITDRDICLAIADANPTSKRVKDVMSSRVKTVTTNDDLDAVLRVMRESQVGRVPVLDGGRKLKGIVSLHSLLSVAASNGIFEGSKAKSNGENILKTVQALTDRYTDNGAQRRVSGPSL